MNISILLFLVDKCLQSFMILLYLFIEVTQVPRNLTSSNVSKIVPLLDGL